MRIGIKLLTLLGLGIATSCNPLRNNVSKQQPETKLQLAQTLEDSIKVDTFRIPVFGEILHHPYKYPGIWNYRYIDSTKTGIFVVNSDFETLQHYGKSTSDSLKRVYEKSVNDYYPDYKQIDHLIVETSDRQKLYEIHNVRDENNIIVERKIIYYSHLYEFFLNSEGADLRTYIERRELEGIFCPPEFLYFIDASENESE